MKHILYACCFVFCMASHTRLHAATTDGKPLFVHLKSGSVDVFGPEILKSYEEVSGTLQVTLVSGRVESYSMSNVSSYDTNTPELPVFTSYKFNNKYNDQLPTDVIADITPDKVTASVGAIGKWLTASFQVSDPSVTAYVDGVAQETKVSRIHFDTPRTYTLALPGMRTLTYKKVKDEVWSTPGEGNVTLNRIALTEDMLSTNAPSNYGEDLKNMLDGDPTTFFHSTWGSGDYTQLPEGESPYIQIEMPQPISKLRFNYTTRYDQAGRCPTGLAWQVSGDGGATWTTVKTLTTADGLPSNQTGASYTSPTIDLGGTYSLMRLTLLSADYKNYLCLAEFSIDEVVSETTDEPELLEPAVYEYLWEPYGRNVTVDVEWLTDKSTNVPRVDINIDGGAVPTDKENYLNATITIDGAGVFPDFTDAVRIRGRGNSSWTGWAWGKNPYRLKFSSAVKPFGLTKGKNWVLLANSQQGSMMTNAVAMKAARLVGTAAANDIIPVELYLNGQYWGSYNFTQQVGISNNSIDLEDETNAIRLELDSYFDEPYKFRESFYNLPVNIKDPDLAEVSNSSELYTQIEDDFNRFTQALHNGPDYEQLVDVEMLARYLVLNELVRNTELGHPKSAFLYKEDLQALHSRYVFGPVWDFDWAFGYEGTGSYCQNYAETDFFTTMVSNEGRKFFYDLRYNCEPVRRACYAVWKNFMENNLEELLDFVDEYYAYANPSFLSNASSRGDGRNYATIAANTRSWLKTRAEYVYRNIETFNLDTPLPITVGDVNKDGAITMADVICVLNYLVGKDNESFDRAQADADGNGDISINDAVHIIALVMNQPADLTRHMRLPQAEAALQAAGFEASIGLTATLPLTLRIGEGSYSAAQMDLTLPEGMRLDGVELSDAMTGAKVQAAELGNGSYRIAVYAENGLTLPAGNTTLSVQLTPQQMIPSANRVVSISSAMLSTSQGEDCRLAPRSASFSLNATTGIEGQGATSSVSGGQAITVESLAPAEIHVYAVDGRLLRTVKADAGTTRIDMPQGVYIVNNQKVIVK